ncbi:MAG: cytochrome c [Thermoleophilaceae bacterium]|nr:cytochrome c [Thermoleophilaceae bacterium]
MGPPAAQARTDRLASRRAGRIRSLAQQHGRPVLNVFRTALVVCAIAASAALAGCGSSTPPATGDNPGDGKAIFTDAGCAGCHAFSPAGSNGGSGPDLNGTSLTLDQISEQVIQGGGGMPAFATDLTDQQIQAVSEFVASGGESE